MGYMKNLLSGSSQIENYFVKLEYQLDPISSDE